MHRKPRRVSSSRRSLLAGAGAALAAAALPKRAKAAELMKITKIETYLIAPRWQFLKIHTNAGIVGWGEPIVEGRALTVAQAIKEVEPYLIGKDPRHITHHWQAIYRHAFYRGGDVLTSALSGIDQALWDIKGKALGVPVYELLGGPTRQKIRVYAHLQRKNDFVTVHEGPERIKLLKQRIAEGFTAFKVGPRHTRSISPVENRAFIDDVVADYAELRKVAGPKIDIAIDFHGKVPPQTAKVLIKALEPYGPYFIEEPVLPQYVDLMADLARGTHLPIATGERVFTKWGFREILEKRAASIIQPDTCHAGGITEVKIIAGMAEAHYATMAPHNPLGPISLAACLQVAAAIPNFLCQEQVTLGEGYLKKPFVVKNGYVDLPTGPGLGIEIDEERIRPLIGVHTKKNLEAYDTHDGSVVDW